MMQWVYVSFLVFCCRECYSNERFMDNWGFLHQQEFLHAAENETIGKK